MERFISLASAQECLMFNGAVLELAGCREHLKAHNKERVNEREGDGRSGEVKFTLNILLMI
jgi:hypothetical protein